MGTVQAIVTIVIFGFVIIGIPVMLSAQVRDSTRAMNQVPDDMRRADDGLEPNPASGPDMTWINPPS
jgi:hypothetical protein